MTMQNAAPGREPRRRDEKAAATSANFDGIRLATLPRKDGDELRVSLREYNGFAYLDIRNWWTRRDTGEKRPGKGITIKIRELGEVANAIDRATSMVDRSGRIATGAPTADPPDLTASW